MAKFVVKVNQNNCVNDFTIEGEDILVYKNFATIEKRVDGRPSWKVKFFC